MSTREETPEVQAEEVAEPAMAGVGQAVRGDSARRRGEGRRVTLAKGMDGYSIWMMNRHVQSFCNEWEIVTNFQLPEGIEQQVRIHVEAVGEARPLRPEYQSNREQPVAVPEIMEEPPRDRELLNIASPRHSDDPINPVIDYLTQEIERMETTLRMIHQLRR